MTIAVDKLRILKWPHPSLSMVAEPVRDITDHVRGAAAQMIRLMNTHTPPGIGLAATQVGLLYELFVANPYQTFGGARVFINPVLTDFSLQAAKQAEGCLSLPGASFIVKRFKRCTIKAQGLDGKRFEIKGSGFEARVWQHEVDHLRGVTIIDHGDDQNKFKPKQRKRR